MILWTQQAPVCLASSMPMETSRIGWFAKVSTRVLGIGAPIKNLSLPKPYGRKETISWRGAGQGPGKKTSHSCSTIRELEAGPDPTHRCRAGTTVGFRSRKAEEDRTTHIACPEPVSSMDMIGLVGRSALKHSSYYF